MGNDFERDKAICVIVACITIVANNLNFIVILQKIFYIFALSNQNK